MIFVSLSDIWSQNFNSWSRILHNFPTKVHKFISVDRKQLQNFFISYEHFDAQL